MIVNNSNLNLSNKTNKTNDIKYNYDINIICDFKINEINENKVLFVLSENDISIKSVYNNEMIYMKIRLMSVLVRLLLVTPRVLELKPNTPVKLYMKLKILTLI